MPQPSKVVNPFYVLLVLAGCAFAITASAYGVMTVRQLHRSRADVSPSDDRFMELVDRLSATCRSIWALTSSIRR